MESYQTSSPFSVPNSYSRRLDQMVSDQEMPYGYETAPPPYDHENAEAKMAKKDQNYGRRK